MKKKIILLWPFGFRKFDWKRYELSYLEKENFEIEVHELVNFLIPHFTSAFHELLKDEKVKRFKNFSEWKNYMHNHIKENKENIFILKHALDNNINFNFLKINREIKKLDIKTLKISGISHPVMTLQKKFYLNHFFQNMIRQFKKNVFAFNIRKFILNFLYLNFYKKDDYNLCFNKINFDRKYLDKTTNIKANSFDYSSSIIIQKTTPNLKKNFKYALFLEAPTPLFKGDELIWEGQNEGFTKEKWFPSLRTFFDKLEKHLNLKVIVAPHPKVKHEKFPPYYGGRAVSEQSLVESSYQADLIITHWSAGLSFGVIYNKPIMLITSDELIKNQEFVRQQELFSKELGTDIINIDKKIDETKINKILEIDKAKYLEYIQNYCTTRTDGKRNFQIITDIINNNLT